MLIIPSGWVPVGRSYYTDKLSAAVELTDAPDGGDALPATADTAIIYVTSNDIHLTFEFNGDGEAADTSDPLYPKDNFIILENARTALSGISMIESAASSRVDCWFFNVMGR